MKADGTYWHLELSQKQFICKYWAEQRPLCSMHGSQSAQNWPSWNSGFKILQDAVVFKCKQSVIFLRGHGGSTF